MPNKSAAEKALRQTKKRRTRNISVKRVILESTNEARRSLATKKADVVNAAVHKAIRVLDRAAQKGVIKANAASRKKSSLMAAVKKAGLDPKTVFAPKA